MRGSLNSLRWRVTSALRRARQHGHDPLDDALARLDQALDVWQTTLNGANREVLEILAQAEHLPAPRHSERSLQQLQRMFDHVDERASAVDDALDRVTAVVSELPDTVVWRSASDPGEALEQIRWLNERYQRLDDQTTRLSRLEIFRGRIEQRGGDICKLLGAGDGEPRQTSVELVLKRLKRLKEPLGRLDTLLDEGIRGPLCPVAFRTATHPCDPSMGRLNQAIKGLRSAMVESQSFAQQFESEIPDIWQALDAGRAPEGWSWVASEDRTTIDLIPQSRTRALLNGIETAEEPMTP